MSTPMLKIYLAGPDVFLPQPLQRAEQMRQICQAHGLDAISPLDPLPGEQADVLASLDPYVIARRNEAHIRDSDAVLANLTPFRGPGADPGTVYEIGYARALGRTVFGYATVAADHATRVRALDGSTATADAAGLAIEDFGLFENLMITCGIEASGGFTITADTPDRWGDLSVFRRCVAAAATLLLGQPAIPAAAAG
ncbi:nucleoside 2-deoxyribosyltransferase [Acidisphaera sp. L21]|jgi:nucleoside 2-deoxyribosyltransferase|uniref:nucleoside 2-deoxyribosyltransferase n=1 Tax=Acidisphaera sp. L21 TaxID=1641851 RepID=UPI0020B137DE|nr:nucleoside 2-deoxyribosyltransferase [Acidisphaera sp. L21]